MSRVGRPKSDNPRNKTISETRVTREEYRVIHIKSALYAGGSTAKLIRNAVEAYEGKIREETACKCGKTANLQLGNESFWFNTSRGEREIIVTGVPQYHCSCGEVLGDLIVSAAIEEELSALVEECLKKNIPIPKHLKLQTLLNSEPIVGEVATV